MSNADPTLESATFWIIMLIVNVGIAFGLLIFLSIFRAPFTYILFLIFYIFVSLGVAIVVGIKGMVKLWNSGL